MTFLASFDDDGWLSIVADGNSFVELLVFSRALSVVIALCCVGVIVTCTISSLATHSTSSSIASNLVSCASLCAGAGVDSFSPSLGDTHLISGSSDFVMPAFLTSG